MNFITLTNLESKTLVEYPVGKASKLAEVVI